MKNNYFLTALLFLCIMSCDDNSVTKKEPLALEEALSIFTNSEYAQMANDIGFEKYDLGAFLEVDDNKQILIVNANFTGKSHHSGGKISEMENHYLISVFDKNNDLFGASAISSNDDIQNVETSEYSGSTVLQLFHSEDDEVYSAEYVFIDGSLVELNWLHNHEGGREEYHNPIMECTGGKFETEFDFEEALCYVGFMGCFVARWADCVAAEWLN